jgi:hypothetical protein
MSVFYGKNVRRVPPNNVTLTLNNMTLVSSGSDARGAYYVSAYVNSDSPGCGNPKEPSILVTIDDAILPGWKYVTFKSYGTFVASCWNLNESSWLNNLSSYSVAAGDKIFRSTNCFELSQFTVKTSACDNDPTNAFHSSFYVGTYREWYQMRRRNNLAQSAGPAIQLSCNSVGATSVITISDMYVFY